MTLFHERSGAEIVKSEGYAIPTTVDERTATFDESGDMIGILNLGNATLLESKIWTNDSYRTTARRVVAKWHQGSATYTATAGAGPLAVGARVTINADNSTAAAARLALTDVTGGETTSAGAPDTYQLSGDNPVIDITVDTPITRIDAIGIPKAGADPTTIMASYLEIQVTG